MAEASLSKRNGDAALLLGDDASVVACPSHFSTMEVKMMIVETCVHLNELELDVPFSDFSCLLDNQVSDLLRLTKLFDLKRYIWAQKEFQSQIFNSMELKIVQKPAAAEEEKEEEQQQQQTQEEEKEEENANKQSQNQHDNPQEEQQQQQQQQQQGEESRKTSVQTQNNGNGEQQHESCTKRWSRTDSLKSTTAQQESHYESSSSSSRRQKRPRRSERSTKNPSDIHHDDYNNHVVDFMFERNANVFHEKEQLQEKEKEKEDKRRRKHKDDGEDSASTMLEASDNRDVDAGKSNQAEIIDKNEKSKASDDDDDDDDNSDNDDESTTEYKILKKVLLGNGPLGMKVKRQVLYDGCDDTTTTTTTTTIEIPVVIAVEEGSQADNAGIQVGDEFIQVAGEECLSYNTFLFKCQERPLYLKVKRRRSNDGVDNNNDAPVQSENETDREKVGTKTNREKVVRKYSIRISGKKKRKSHAAHGDVDAFYQSENEIEDEKMIEDDEGGVEKITLNLSLSDRDALFAENLHKLKEFYKEKGHYRVPLSNEKYRTLAKWLQNSKHYGRMYRENKYDIFKEKHDILNELEGFDWGFPLADKSTTRSKHYDWKKYDWDACYEMLKEYKEKHGHCDVSRNDKDNPILAIWVRNMKIHGRKIRIGSFSTILTPERMQKLKDIGLTADWKKNTEAWNDMYNRLKRYKEQYGDCLVPKRWPADKKLGMWVFDMRKAYKHRQNGIQTCKMTDERRELLEKLGFVWRVR